MRKRTASLIIFLCTAAAVPLFPNDGSYSYVNGSQSGAAMPINNAFIRMDSEKIEIQVKDLGYRKQRLGGGMDPSTISGGNVITKCTFQFSNTSDIEQTCLMGFPIRYPEETARDMFGNVRRTKILQVGLTYFDCRVGGKPVLVTFADHADNPLVPQVANYDGVYLFSVTFKPEESLTIENLCIQALSRRHDEPCFVQYILMSGLTWNSPIGRADISIEFMGIPAEILKLTNSSYPITSMDDSTCRWSFQGFTPTRDLSIDFDLQALDKTRLAQAIRKYSNSKEYGKLYWLHDIIESRTTLGYADIGIPSDELRKTFFDAGNWFYALHDFQRAEEMYIAAIAADTLFQSTMRRMNTSPGTPMKDLYGAWVAAVVDIKYDHDFTQGLRNQKITIPKGQTAPLYYLFYNMTCIESLRGNSTFSYLEAALAFGYPKEERKWFSQDPDLEYLRAVGSRELADLLGRYN